MATPTTLPATAVSGDILTASYVNNLRGAFRVLQVVNFTYGATKTSSSTAYADTDLTASITPSSATSKVLIIFNHCGPLITSTSASNSIAIKLMRGATFLADFTFRAGLATTGGDRYGYPITGIYLDSPATTSATSYKTQFANFVAGAAVSLQFQGEASTITLMEISA
jgi:hypothetical protein